MPELPEVETIRRGLATRILHQPISKVEVSLAKIVKGDHQHFIETVQGSAIENLDRRGKLLIAKLSVPDTYLLLHLKMTGQLIYRHNQEQIAGGHPWPSYDDALPNKYSHLILTFADGAKLFFNDQRQFGYAMLVNEKEMQRIRGQFGIEPLTDDFLEASFLQRLAHRKTALKAVLLNQQIISGLGNIYVDEICFDSHVRPDRSVATLTDNEKKALYQSCKKIIAAAVEQRGTTMSDYVDADGKHGNYSDFLMVYGRGGQACLRCKTGVITKTQLVGRGTHFCPQCQH